MRASLTQDVGHVLQECAAEIVMPQFRRITAVEINEKSPGELVTQVDLACEAAISRALIDLIPGSHVVGEEAASARPTLLNDIAQGHVWLVDPLDGTQNFIEGLERFSIMVALLREGETLCSWMLDPVTSLLSAAERGAGAYSGGERLRCRPTPVSAEEWKGAILERFLPDPVRARVKSIRSDFGAVLPGLRCAGHEYPAIAEGEEQFAVFWRSLPWDHVPGALFLSEAGGVVARPDGSPYRAADKRSGLIAAADCRVFSRVASLLFGAEEDPAWAKV